MLEELNKTPCFQGVLFKWTYAVLRCIRCPDRGCKAISILLANGLRGIRAYGVFPALVIEADGTGYRWFA